MSFTTKILIISLTVLSTTFALSLQGLNNRLPQPRIVGGIEAEPHSAPYIVTLALRTRNSRYRPFCGGALINESWILTAAHCLEMDAFRIHLIAGHHDMLNLNDSMVQIRRSDFYREHAEFNAIGPYDIGLIHVSRPFNLSTPYVQTINITETADPLGELTLYGWGSTTNTTERQFPTRLQTTNLTIVTNDYCREVFQPAPVEETNICAGLPAVGLSACVGDSGGPAVQDGALIGVVSWGTTTCDSEMGPTVFTNVNAYARWINSTMAGELNDEDEDDDDDDDEEEEEEEEEEAEEGVEETEEGVAETEEGVEAVEEGNGTVAEDEMTGAANESTKLDDENMVSERMEAVLQDQIIIGQEEEIVKEKNLRNMVNDIKDRVISFVMNYNQLLY